MDDQAAVAGDNQGFERSEADEADEVFDKNRSYWATWKGKLLVDALKEKEQAYFETARNRGLLALWVIAYASHHGLTPQDLRDFSTQQIAFEGNELELIRFHINVVRPYVRRQSIMALGEKAAFKAMVVNSDHQSQVVAEISDKVINSLYSRYSEIHDGPVAEGDGVFGMAGTHYRWNLHGGDEVDVEAPVMQPETDQLGQPVAGPDGAPAMQQAQLEDGSLATHTVKAKSGAPVVTQFYPWGAFNETRASGEQLWMCIREQESKWNLCATFPDKRDAILDQKTANDQYDFGQLFRLSELDFANNDLCTVKHFYHARCPAMPDGRYAMMVGNVLLYDTVCPTKTGIPVATMCSAKFIETTFGYADSWDMLAIAQALNQVNSDEMQNYALYGKQSVGWEKGTNITVDGLTHGTAYEWPVGSKPPVAIQLSAIPGTLPQFKQYLHSMLDHESGQSPTSRGEPEANVRSGEMAALLDSISLRYQSFRQQSARNFRIRGATIILDMIKRYGETPFLVEVAGINNRPYVSEFTRDDLSGVERVTMDVVSPLMQQASGRWQVYTMLAALPEAERPAAYEFIVSGDTSLLMPKNRESRMQARRENEDLVTGARPVFATAGEDAMMHYQLHAELRDQILASDDQDPEALMRINKHMEETVQTWLSSSGLGNALRGVQSPPALGPTADNPYGNPMYQLNAQIAAGQAMTGGAGVPPPQPEQAAGGGKDGNASAPAGNADPGAAAQVNDQGTPQKHPSGTNLPAPSTPPGN